ncbi:hypothetical protein ABH926_008884 [Catenulispora sp. GP43]|uniref:hypothetical protein n=1 Tax=Catenulispora sp. GP43 TaxID=3156263 RepID=UPI003518165E
MSSETTPTRRPIAALRVSTVALLGVVAAVAVPAGAAAIVLSGSINSQQKQQILDHADQVTRVVVVDEGGSVRIAGNAALFGVTGHATLTWHAFSSGATGAKVTEQFADGVLTLTKDCAGVDCDADIDIQVPPAVSVQVTTSDAGITVTNVAGGVELHDSNASISAKQLGAGDAWMQTSNAPISATFAGGPKNIFAHTSNASVSITTDDRSSYFDKLSTSNADVRQDNPNQDRRADNVIDALTSNAPITVK